jgi:hypothetical protein
VKEFKKRFQIQTVPSWIKQVINAKASTVSTVVGVDEVGDCIELGEKYETFKELATSIQRCLWKHHSVRSEVIFI